MKTGKVSLFKEGTGKGCGYGFIVDDETGKDIFFHFTKAYKGIKEGDRVVFDTVDGDRGICAVNITQE